jgi:hypothetical protein
MIQLHFTALLSNLLAAEVADGPELLELPVKTLAAEVINDFPGIGKVSPTPEVVSVTEKDRDVRGLSVLCVSPLVPDGARAGSLEFPSIDGLGWAGDISSEVDATLAVYSDGIVRVVEYEYVGSAEVPPGIVVGAADSVTDTELKSLPRLCRPPSIELYGAASIVKGGLF